MLHTRSLNLSLIRGPLVAAVLLLASAFTPAGALAFDPPSSELHATVNGPASVTLTWDDYADAAMYTVELRTPNISSWGDRAGSKILPAHTTTWTEDRIYMMCNVTYGFKVTYRLDEDFGADIPYTDEVWVTTDPCPAPEPGTWAIPDRRYYQNDGNVWEPAGLAGLNRPEGRGGASYVRDASGDVLMFGGKMSTWINAGHRSMSGATWDIWKWDGVNWSRLAGPDTLDGTQLGVYGTKGVADPANHPGGRYDAIIWVDTSGNLWVYGGLGFDDVSPDPGSSAGTQGREVPLADLWKWDGINWTWVAGSNQSTTDPVYGTQGVADPGNTPGGRTGFSSWVDSSGNLWLFGGYWNGGGRRNDLWKFDGANWAWVKGSTAIDQPAVSGTLGMADTANTPAGRDEAAVWADASGNAWLFSGNSGYMWPDGNGGTRRGYFMDLWKWDGTNWTLINGQPGQTADILSVHGAQGVADAGNHPGSRKNGVLWGDASGNLWLFGGVGHGVVEGQVGVSDNLNDIWKWDDTNWTWIDGSDVPGQTSLALSGYQDNALLFPGRPGGAYWSDSSGNLWMTSVQENAYASDLLNIWKYALPDGSTQFGCGILQNCSFETPADSAPPPGVAGVAAAAPSPNMPAGWTGSGLKLGTADSNDGLRSTEHSSGARSFTFAASGKGKSLSQTIYVSGPAGTTFNLNFNGSASAPFSVTVTLTYTDKKLGKFSADVKNPQNDWVAYRQDFTAAKAFNKVQVDITYKKGGAAWFDNFKLASSIPLVSEPPVLTAPKNGSILYASPSKLTWKAQPGAQEYHIQLDDVTDPLNVVNVSDEDIPGAAFIPPQLDFGLYTWQVKTRNIVDWGSYSAPFSFEVTLNKLPKKGATLKNGVVKFSWYKVKNATYQLRVFTDPLDPANTLAFPVQSPAKPSYAVDKTAPLPAGTYYWQVSIDGGTTWTPAWSFIVP